MQTTFLHSVRRIALVTVAFAFLAPTPLFAATALSASISGDGTNHSVADNGPSAEPAARSLTVGSGFDRGGVMVRAGFGELSADARSLGRPAGRTEPGGGASFSTDDFQLTIIDEANCESACFGYYPVSVSVTVDGSFSRFGGADVPGRGRADGRLLASGAICANRFGDRFSVGTISHQVLFDSHQSSDGLGPASKTLFPSFRARPGELHSISGRLAVVAGSGYEFFDEHTGIVSAFSGT